MGSGVTSGNRKASAALAACSTEGRYPVLAINPE